MFFIAVFADIHYFHCLRIIEILKKTEVSTKNIFGRYSSQRMKVMLHSSAVLFCFECIVNVYSCEYRRFNTFFILHQQDWQEIVSHYEKENVYLGKAEFPFFCIIKLNHSQCKLCAFCLFFYCS